MPRLSRTNVALSLVLVLALGLRLAAGWWWQERLPAGQTFFFGDSHTYWVLGERITSGEPYYYGSPDTRVFRTPGYPLLLAGLFKLVGNEPSVLWARGLSGVLGTLAVGGVYWLARLLFQPATAVLAALAAAVYPGAVSLGAFVLSEAPFCPLMLLQLIFATIAWRQSDPTHATVMSVLAGISAGLATLARPSWLLFTPFAIGLALLFARRKGRHLWLGLAAMSGLIAVMTPWWVRNYQVTGHFVATTLQTGASLYDGLHEGADGSSDMSFEPAMAAAERAAEGGQPQTEIFEYRLDRRMRSEAIAWAQANPGRAAQLTGIKLVRMWNIWPNEEEFRSIPLRLVIAATYTPIIFLALFGAWKFSRQGWPYVLLWLPAVYLSLIHMIFIGSLRYREPVMLPLIVLAAGAAMELLQRRGGGAIEAVGNPQARPLPT